MRWAAGGLVACLLGFVPGQAAAPPPVPTPESVLGFRVGEDRKLADWTDLIRYFEALAASPRVLVENVGETTEGRPFLVVTITSEANQKRLEELRRKNLRLADPRGLSDPDAEALLRDGKTIVVSNHGIHSTEVAGSLTAVELAYLLSTSQAPEILEILDETVLVMVPSANPDGTQKVAEWYRKTLGTPFEAGPLPFLYQRHAGHDNNRDWYMFTQQETRLTLTHVYDRWRPQIVHDLHQMGPRSARFFVPPYLDPWEPNVDEALVAAANGLGAHIAARLIGAGKTGVAIHAIYDAWSPSRAYPHTHGGVRLLSECASARLASPIEVRSEELEPSFDFDPRQASWNHPSVWPGGTWRLRDAVDYQIAASLALLEHAARFRRYWLESFLSVNRRACARATPFAFVVPARQRDPLATEQLIEVLGLGAVEVERARAAFQADGLEYPAGSHVVRMRQPFSAFAKTLLEPQRYPDQRLCRGGPRQAPYDATAHTLPLLLGVEVARIETPFEAEVEPVTCVERTPGAITGDGPRIAIGHGTAEMIALGRLLRAGVPVRWVKRSFQDDGRFHPAGTLLVPATARDVLEPIVRELGIPAEAVTAEPESLLLRAPRVGLYQSWVASIDEGWTRFVFERQLEVDYTTQHDADIRRGGLSERFDVIVLPDQAADAMLQGHHAGALPDEYVGGLGREGTAELARFVATGGTLLALNRACELAVSSLDLPVKDALLGLRRGTQDPGGFLCPGSILKVRVDSEHPLGHGLPDPLPVWFENGPAFRLERGLAVFRYPEDPLLSGWLSGSEHLAGKTALAEVRHGRGRVVLFGFRPQYRAQSWSTYVALLNAIYTSATQATPGPPP
jgi:hypothetical protein